MAIARTLFSAGKFVARGTAEAVVSRSRAGRTALAVAALMGRATPLGRAFLVYELGRAAYDWRREYKKAKAMREDIRAREANPTRSEEPRVSKTGAAYETRATSPSKYEVVTPGKPA